MSAIFQHSLKDGVVPYDWKNADVAPAATDFAFITHHTRTVTEQTKDNTIAWLTGCNALVWYQHSITPFVILCWYQFE